VAVASEGEEVSRERVDMDGREFGRVELWTARRNRVFGVIDEGET
jgi:hypothetical protein